MKLTASDFFTDRQWTGETQLRTIRSRMKDPRKLRRTFIREWRSHRKLTLEELAARVGLRSSHLSMLERGHRGYTQDTLERVADALDTTVGALTMHGPGDDEEGDLWSLWDQAEPTQKRQILAIAKTITKP